MKFSIIIPVYNVAPYLRECLDSVLEPCRGVEGVDVEAVCVDDGSTDGSGAILDEYAAKDSRVKVIHQPNEGVSVARNVAIENATGDWIFCLDADDLLEPDFLAKAAERIDNQIGTDFDVDFDVDVVVVVVRRMFKDGRLERGPIPEEAKVLTREELFSIREPQYMTYTELMTDKLIRRSLLVDKGIRFVPGIRISEDNLFTRMVLANSPKVLLATDINAARYRMREDSVIHTMSADKYLDNLRTFKRFVAFAKERKQVKMMGKVLADQASALMFMARRDPAARRECIETLIHDPAFNRTAMWLMLRYCRFPKPRIFALAYLLMPLTVIRRLLLGFVK